MNSAIHTATRFIQSLKRHGTTFYLFIKGLKCFEVSQISAFQIVLFKLLTILYWIGQICTIVIFYCYFVPDVQYVQSWYIQCPLASHASMGRGWIRALHRARMDTLLVAINDAAYTEAAVGTCAITLHRGQHAPPPRRPSPSRPYAIAETTSAARR
jgi:heme/copper-type cytochrome/quinol oxidase subunit 1